MKSEDDYKKFSGPAPDWSKATSLVQVNLDGNSLTGTMKLPASVLAVSLTNNMLNGLDFSAPPDQLSLIDLQIDGNQLDGTIPDYMSSAPKLIRLSATNNGFTSLPGSWSTPALGVINLHSNQLQVCSSEVFFKVK